MNDQVNTSDALLIVDVQNGFVNGSTKHIPTLVEQLQHSYEYVVATQFFNEEGSFYRKLIGWNRLQRDSGEFDLAFDLRKDALVVEKPIYTCVGKDFLSYLAANEIETIDICGIDTDICVTKCAVDLFEAGIEPIVLKDYCGSTAGRDHHEYALRTLARFIGKDQVR